MHGKEVFSFCVTNSSSTFHPCNIQCQFGFNNYGIKTKWSEHNLHALGIINMTIMRNYHDKCILYVQHAMILRYCSTDSRYRTIILETQLGFSKKADTAAVPSQF